MNARTSEPSGRTIGYAPLTELPSVPSAGVGTAADQVRPPSVERRTAILFAVDVVVGQVAATAEAARAAVVAGEPLLVVVLRFVGRGDHRRLPGASVGRAVDREQVARLDGERRGEPHAVHGVVGDNGIAHGVERAAARRLVDEPRQQSRPPGDAGVGGRRPAVRRGAPALVPARLEEGDDRRAEGEAVRLDLRLVLALRVHRRVPGELEAQHLAVGRHAVDPLRDDHVTSGAAAHVVARPVELDADPVGARAAVDEVATGAALEKVGASATRKPIVPTVAADRVGRLRAVQRVRSRRARDRRARSQVGRRRGRHRPG